MKTIFWPLILVFVIVRVILVPDTALQGVFVFIFSALSWIRESCEKNDSNFIGTKVWLAMRVFAAFLAVPMFVLARNCWWTWLLGVGLSGFILGSSIFQFHKINFKKETKS